MHAGRPLDPRLLLAQFKQTCLHDSTRLIPQSNCPAKLRHTFKPLMGPHQHAKDRQTSLTSGETLNLATKQMRF